MRNNKHSLWLRSAIFSFCLVATFTTLGLQEVYAQGDGPMPGWWDNLQEDTTKTDNAFLNAINYLIYAATGFGTLALAAGLIALTPIVGKKEFGMDVIKGSVIVLVGTLAFWVVLGSIKGFFN